MALQFLDPPLAHCAMPNGIFFEWNCSWNLYRNVNIANNLFVGKLPDVFWSLRDHFQSSLFFFCRISMFLVMWSVWVNEIRSLFIEYPMHVNEPDECWMSRLGLSTEWGYNWCSECWHWWWEFSLSYMVWKRRCCCSVAFFIPSKNVYIRLLKEHYVYK